MSKHRAESEAARPSGFTAQLADAYEPRHRAEGDSE